MRQMKYRDAHQTATATNYPAAAQSHARLCAKVNYFGHFTRETRQKVETRARRTERGAGLRGSQKTKINIGTHAAVKKAPASRGAAARRGSDSRSLSLSLRSQPV